VRHRAFSGPSSRSRRRRRARRAALAAPLLLALAGCATFKPPPPRIAAAAAVALTYSGSLRVKVKGEDVRGRSRVLLGFRRPGSIRLEIPGPSGARLVAVVHDGRLTAVLPGDRAVFEGAATADDLDALLGVRLAPDELMDVLVGVAPPRLTRYEARWGERLPRQIDARLPDGTRIEARVDDAEIGVDLPAAAFAPPPHPGYRPVDAAEARRLLGGR
jgi:hypothetical protein